jgi:hypothetical protein
MRNSTLVYVGPLIAGPFSRQFAFANCTVSTQSKGAATRMAPAVRYRQG